MRREGGGRGPGYFKPFFFQPRNTQNTLKVLKSCVLKIDVILDGVPVDFLALPGFAGVAGRVACPHAAAAYLLLCVETKHTLPHFEDALDLLDAFGVGELRRVHRALDGIEPLFRRFELLAGELVLGVLRLLRGAARKRYKFPRINHQRFPVKILLWFQFIKYDKILLN